MCLSVYSKVNCYGSFVAFAHSAHLGFEASFQNKILLSQEHQVVIFSEECFGTDRPHLVLISFTFNNHFFHLGSTFVREK